MKSITKTLFVMLAVLLGFNTNAIAEETILSPSETTVIKANGKDAGTETNADANFYVANATEWLCTQANISNGNLNNQNANYDGSRVVITKFDTSTQLTGKTITKATLKFRTVCTVSGKNSNVIVSSIGTDWDATTVTWNNMDKAAQKISASDGQNSNTTAKYLTEDVTNLLNADEDKVVAFAIYTFTAREQKISEIQLIVEAVDASSSAEVKLSYVDGENNELKSETIIASTQNSYTLTDAQKAPFFANDKKYFYVSDNSSEVSIASDGSSVITVVCREGNIYNYTLNSNLGVITTGTGYEGETIAVGYPRYALVDGVFYEAPKTRDSKKEYRIDIALTSDEASASITYSEKQNANAVFFTEAENIEGVTVTTTGNLPVRGSNATGATTTEDVLITNLPNGKYKFHAGIFTSKTSYSNLAVNFGIGEKTFEAKFTGVNLNEIVSAEYELNKASTPISYLASSSADTQFDYIWIEKTGDAEIVFDPSTVIVNAGFAPTANPLGWEKVVSAQYNDVGMYQIGGEQMVRFVAPTADDTHLSTEYAAGFECRWSTNFASYTQSVTLPAGAYALSFDVENVNGATTKAAYENLFNVKIGDAIYVDESTEWMDGKSAWTTHTIKFEIAQESTATISLGYGTGSNNIGADNTPAIYVSHMKLESINPLESALIDLKKAIDAAQAKLATYTIGGVYFTYPAEEIAPLALMIGFAQAAYEKAESVEAVEKATKDLNDYVASFDPIMQIPSKEKAYYIANKTAEGNLCIGNEAVTIAKDAAVFFTEVEGGFVLSNEEGNYILKTAGNTWTLSTTANKDEAYVVNFNLVDGAYTIQGANGLFGTDNTNEGSQVYANKAQANNGLWTITAKPEFEPAYGTLWTEAEGSSIDEGTEFNYITLDNKYFKNFARVGDTIKVAISSVGNQNSGSRARIITQGKLNLKIDNAGEEKTIDQGTNSADFVLDEEEIAKIQEGANVVINWQYITVAQVDLVEMKDRPIIEEGKYYLTALALAEKENNTMAAGMTWGTQGIVNNVGLDLNFIYNATAKTYTIDTNIYNGANNHFLGSNLFMDAPAFEWSVENNETAGFNIYAMFEGVKKYISVASDNSLELSETPYAWVFIAESNWDYLMKAEHEKTLNAATAENGVDATFLLKDANFNRNDHRWEAWTVSEDCTNKNLGGGCSETNGNGCAESYHSTFTISQLAEGAPKGIYAVTAQGFYRQDANGEFALPYFFVNDEKADLPLRTGTENSMTEAGISFENGLYTIDPIYVEVADGGTLTVGVKSETANFWCIWDNFKLTYYGATATMDEVKNGAIVKELADLRAKAQSMLAEIDVDAVKTAINDALTATADVTGADAINAAIATMKAVIEKAEASVIAKNVLPMMKQLTEETNVYTAAAFNTYYTEPLAKYENGTLTKVEAAQLENPYTVTSWHTANTVDDLLMSAWDAEPMNWDTYHVNTWSVEGSQDGTNFVVPFIEYWVGDGESLAEKTMTATVNDLQNGVYDVTAWVRVRIKNGAEAPATGIFLQANDSEGVSVVGENVTGQFYLKEVAVQAVVESGELKIKFNVAAENNISWLAFKNVKFAYNESATVGITNVNNAKNANDAIYNLNGQKVEKAKKGLYIINGKKVVIK